MKKVLIILMIIGGIAGCIYDSMPIPHTTIVSEMRDITSSHKAQPEPGTILSLFTLSTNEWDGAVYRSQDLTDISYNPIKQVNINSANEWLGNSFDRDREVKEFYHKISKLIGDTTSEYIGREQSSIFASVARELNLLSQSKGDTKVVLIYSDLMENTPAFSFYRDKDLNLLKISPEKVRAYFLKIVPLNDLKGIEVHLIYQPKGIAENTNYQLISSLYKSLLESMGAKVFISGNLVN